MKPFRPNRWKRPGQVSQRFSKPQNLFRSRQRQDRQRCTRHCRRPLAQPVRQRSPHRTQPRTQSRASKPAPRLLSGPLVRNTDPPHDRHHGKQHKHRHRVGMLPKPAVPEPPKDTRTQAHGKAATEGVSKVLGTPLRKPIPARSCAPSPVQANPGSRQRKCPATHRTQTHPG